MENEFALAGEMSFRESKCTLEGLVGLPGRWSVPIAMEKCSFGLESCLLPYGGLFRIEIRPGHIIIIASGTGCFGRGMVITALAMRTKGCGVRPK